MRHADASRPARSVTSVDERQWELRIPPIKNGGVPWAKSNKSQAGAPAAKSAESQAGTRPLARRWSILGEREDQVLGV
jgi:hypothetical protein